MTNGNIMTLINTGSGLPRVNYDFKKNELRQHLQLHYRSKKIDKLKHTNGNETTVKRPNDIKKNRPYNILSH